MQLRKKVLALVAGVTLAIAGTGSAVAEPPAHGVKYRGHHKAGLGYKVKYHAKGHTYGHRRARVHNRGHYRVRSHRYFRHYPRHFRARHGHWYRRGGHGFRHHRHHRGVDIGAVVAGLVLGGLVYELLDDDSNEHYEEYDYYDH